MTDIESLVFVSCVCTSLSAMTVELARDAAEVLAAIVTVLGLPFAIFTYQRSKKVEAESRERQFLADQRHADEYAYARLYEDYHSFLEIVIRYPHLDLGDEPLSDPPKWSETERIQALALFNIFLGLAERSFLLYRETTSEIKARQWQGWRDYITEMLSRPHLQAMYLGHKDQYDSEFVAAVDGWVGLT